MRSIESIIKPLLGMVSWGVQWDPQLNMEISFGEPVMTIREPHASKSASKRIREAASRRVVTVKGKWWLWIFCAHWDLHIDAGCQATGASSYKRKSMAMRRLDGQRLVSMQVDKNTGATTFSFDLGATLRLRRFAEDDSDIWTLYFPGRMVLGVRGDGTYTHQDGATPGDKAIPIPLSGA